MREQTGAARRHGESCNILLGQLCPADRVLLMPHLEYLTVPDGTELIAPDTPLDAVYFPTTALVSLEEVMGSGRRVEIAVVGREGMLGWPALLGSDLSAHRAVIQMGEGTMLRVGLGPLRRACRKSPSLWAALLRFVHVIIVQMARAIASHLQHPIDQRLARWLLMRHDRVGGDVLPIHHDEIADGLNVRRASVTDHLHLLEGLHLIQCNRGKVQVRDRPGLEAFAGDAYGTAEEHYRALIAPFGKSRPISAVLLPGMSPVLMNAG